MQYKNELGLIAGSYEELQSIDLLLEIRQSQKNIHLLSSASTIITVLQAIEIALLNIVDLTSRASQDINHQEISLCTVKLCWILSFQEVLAKLSTIPKILTVCSNQNISVSIEESSAFISYAEQVECFDNSFLQYISNNQIDVKNIISSYGIEDNKFNSIHLVRQIYQLTDSWSKHLNKILIPTNAHLDIDYESLIFAAKIREATNNFKLKGDNFFMQFRGSHQISELLGAEVNDLLEVSITMLKHRRINESIEYIQHANLLLECIVLALQPLVKNLSTKDYHVIRENLGLTSGSHSVCLRYHLFHDLYRQIWETINNLLMSCDEAKNRSINDIIKYIDDNRFESQLYWSIHSVLNECLYLHQSIHLWREIHIQLPRNELGSTGNVRSLVGSPDAVMTVKQMADNAFDNDPLLPLLIARFGENSPPTVQGRLNSYFQTSKSLDYFLLKTTGEVTSDKFRLVQNREGLFANRCPFSMPNPRSAI